MLLSTRAFAEQDPIFYVLARVAFCLALWSGVPVRLVATVAALKQEDNGEANQ